jgi:hypothetical protein
MRTNLTFTYEEDGVFQKVESWAASNRYKMRESDGQSMLLQRGGYWSWNAHPKLSIRKDGSNVTRDAWICPIWGGERDISIRGIGGFLAKPAARKQINKLLKLLGQDPLT